MCRPADSLRTVTRAKFSHQRTDVKFDRPLTDCQRQRYLFILQTLGQVSKHLILPGVNDSVSG